MVKYVDLINRKDAIEAVRKAYFDKNIQSARKDPCIVDAVTDWAIRQIKMLPAYSVKEGEMTKYDYELQAKKLLDSALNELSPKAYAELLDSIRFMVDDREEDANGSISGVTKHEGIEKLLNRFGQTISDLPIDELGIAYREHFLDNVINRMEIALQTASDRIDDIRETAVCMGENCRPYEDQRDAGFDEACMEIVRLIDSYSVWNGEKKGRL